MINHYMTMPFLLNAADYFYLNFESRPTSSRKAKLKNSI